MRTIEYEEFGEPAAVLGVQDRPPGPLSPGNVRVRMLASPVNPSDLMTIRGMYGQRPELPAVPGFEGVGRVEESGGGLLGRLLVGKRVAVLNRVAGNWCDETIVPAKQVIPMAKDLSDEQAAMFFVNPATAWVLTRKELRVPTGRWLLQTAAGSAVGRMVIRLGVRFGFRTLNVIRREDQTDELKAIGADDVVVFDPQRHEAGQLRDAVLRITGGRGPQFAIDPVGGQTGSAVVACMGDTGQLIVYGTLADEPLTFSSRQLMTPAAGIRGFWLARWIEAQRLPAKLSLVRRLTGLIREGVLSSDVGEVFPLDRIRDAVRAAEQPGRSGKILLRIAER